MKDVTFPCTKGGKLHLKQVMDINSLVCSVKYVVWVYLAVLVCLLCIHMARKIISFHKTN